MSEREILGSESVSAMANLQESNGIDMAFLDQQIEQGNDKDLVDSDGDSLAYEPGLLLDSEEWCHLWLMHSYSNPIPIVKFNYLVGIATVYYMYRILLKHKRWGADLYFVSRRLWQAHRRR